MWEVTSEYVLADGTIRVRISNGTSAAYWAEGSTREEALANALAKAA